MHLKSTYFRLFLSLLAWTASYPRESNLILWFQGADSEAGRWFSVIYVIPCFSTKDGNS